MSRPTAPGHILILKPSSLGDIVHTLPAVAAIRALHPSARITWLVQPRWGPLLEGNPHVDDLLEFPRDRFRGVGAPLTFAGWLHTLRDLGAALCLDFQGLLRTALAARAVRGAWCLGLSDAREGATLLQHETVTVDPSAHAVERYLALPLALGSPQPEPVFPLPPGVPPAKPVPGEPFVLLHPFSRGRGKSLDPATVQAFLDASPLPVVLAGQAPEDLAALRWSPAWNHLNSTSLPELLWLLRRAAAVVSVDSGPMHIAAALGRPLLSLHTWSDPAKVGPWPREAFVWRGGGIFPARSPEASAAPGWTPGPEHVRPWTTWVASNARG